MGFKELRSRAFELLSFTDQDRCLFFPGASLRLEICVEQALDAGSVVIREAHHSLVVLLDLFLNIGNEHRSLLARRALVVSGGADEVQVTLPRLGLGDLHKQSLLAGTEDPQALKDRRDNEGTSWAKVAPVIAQEDKAIYAPALLSADWESNPEAVTAVEVMVEANESVLSNFMATAYRGSGAVGYKAWPELTETSANASTTGSRILRVDYSNHDNVSESTVGAGAISPGGSVIVDWKVVDDKEYAIAID